jgi:hypothetical protein
VVVRVLPPTPPAEPHMISRKQPWFREILRGSTAEVQLRSWVRRSRIQASPDGGLGEPGLKQQSGAGHADHVSRQPGLLQPVGGSKGFSDPGTRHPNLTVLDGHPHAVAFLANIRQVRATALGVSRFGQASSLDDVYRYHGARCIRGGRTRRPPILPRHRCSPPAEGRRAHSSTRRDGSRTGPRR